MPTGENYQALCEAHPWTLTLADETGMLLAARLGTGTADATTILRGDRTFGALPSAALPAHHTTHETGGTDALTTLSAGILLTGTLPDARLSNTIVAGSAGDATHVAAPTWDAHGRLTGVSSVLITGTTPAAHHA